MNYIEKFKSQHTTSEEDLAQLQLELIEQPSEIVSLYGSNVLSISGLLIGVVNQDSLLPFPRFKGLPEDVKSELLKKGKNKDAKKEKGSETAKKGFRSETLIIEALNNKTLKGLELLGQIKVEDGFVFTSAIETSKHKLSAHNVKSDLLVFYNKEGSEKIVHISQKLVSQSSGFNQLDKRWIDTYKEKLSIPENVVRLLKYYTGETSPETYGIDVSALRDSRRIYFNEMTLEDQEIILNYFNNEKEKIIQFLFCGDNPEYAPNYFLVVQDTSESGDVESSKCVIMPMEEALKKFYNGEAVALTSEGNLKIGHVSMQRKGGDSGRPSANMLQFKINPAILLK